MPARRPYSRHLSASSSDNFSGQAPLLPLHQSTPLGSRDSFGSLKAFSLPDKFTLNPELWADEPVEDFLYSPDPRSPDPRHNGPVAVERTHTVFTRRGAANLGCLFVLMTGILGLFAGYPVLTYYLRRPIETLGAHTITNATGQVSSRLRNFAAIDVDTPQAVYQWPSYNNPDEMWDLVFSDEFNEPGRRFYPGDDPYWEAVDLHYWATNNLEWYDPQQVITRDGALQIWFNQTENHDLNFMGGMMTSWNKFCFTGGMVLANVSLPGNPNTAGLWPAIWSMGNLGRAGYGATLEGMWPYTYDECDVGTLPNQTQNGGPPAALINGDPLNGDILSFLPGQRLSRCTCENDSTHPGPKHPDGTLVGRSAPEIDVLEALVNIQDLGVVSQSAQWAPFDAGYVWQNTTGPGGNMNISNPAVTLLNPYRGGAFQEATSALSLTDQDAYTQAPGLGTFVIYGYEYKPGFAGSYITWINHGVVSWTMEGAGMGANQETKISQRPVPQEPMYLIMNLGMSPSFGRIDPNLQFPVYFAIDWIRVYQPPGQHNIGCDPPDFPTQSYINKFPDAYANPNLTTWEQAGQTFPGNRLSGQCAPGT